MTDAESYRFNNELIGNQSQRKYQSGEIITSDSFEPWQSNSSLAPLKWLSKNTKLILF